MLWAATLRRSYSSNCGLLLLWTANFRRGCSCRLLLFDATALRSNHRRCLLLWVSTCNDGCGYCLLLLDASTLLSNNCYRHFRLALKIAGKG